MLKIIIIILLCLATSFLYGQDTIPAKSKINLTEEIKILEIEIYSINDKSHIIPYEGDRTIIWLYEGIIYEGYSVIFINEGYEESFYIFKKINNAPAAGFEYLINGLWQVKLYDADNNLIAESKKFLVDE